MSEDAGGVDGRHGVVDGEAVVEPLGLHEERADALEAQGAEGGAEVAAGAGERHVRVEDRRAPEELRVEDALEGRRPHLVLHRGPAPPVPRPEADAGAGLRERAVDVPLVAAEYERKSSITASRRCQSQPFQGS